MKKATERLNMIRDVPVATITGLPTTHLPREKKQRKPALMLYRSASCPSLGARWPREALPIPCQYLPRSQSTMALGGESEQCLGPHRVVHNYCPADMQAAPAGEGMPTAEHMLKHLSQVCGCPPPCPPSCSCPGPATAAAASLPPATRLRAACSS
ncbi:hypothetical protein HW555_012583 [Spodoptera exigua]|uniref:Uncharacterized protein n=1 Tax=Spodoptera exigua TaxID=7107 RepID=A0A835G5A7_SPOEX|nr:hypothetical protein HW555_012583 [Spodoptera exigua]